MRSLQPSLTAPAWDYGSAALSLNRMVGAYGLLTTLPAAHALLSPYPPKSRAMDDTRGRSQGIRHCARGLIERPPNAETTVHSIGDISRHQRLKDKSYGERWAPLYAPSARCAPYPRARPRECRRCGSDYRTSTASWYEPATRSSASTSGLTFVPNRFLGGRNSFCGRCPTSIWKNC